jgi:hypothetical protein
MLDRENWILLDKGALVNVRHVQRFARRGYVWKVICTGDHSQSGSDVDPIENPRLDALWHDMRHPVAPEPAPAPDTEPVRKPVRTRLRLALHRA